MTEQLMDEKMTEQLMGERMTEENVGMITETGAETLHKLRHRIREILFYVAFALYLASLALLDFQDDLKNDEEKTPRGYLWFSSAACHVIGDAMWIDIIIASIRYKVVVENLEFNLFMFVAFIVSLDVLIRTGYP